MPSSQLLTFQEANSTPTREPSPTLRTPATPTSLVSKRRICPKTPSKRAKFKSPRVLHSPVNPLAGSSKIKNLKEDLRSNIKNIQDIRSQNLSPLQAGQLASELAQDLKELAYLQASLQEEHEYMLKLSLSGSK